MSVVKDPVIEIHGENRHGTKEEANNMLMAIIEQYTGIMHKNGMPMEFEFKLRYKRPEPDSDVSA